MTDSQIDPNRIQANIYCSKLILLFKTILILFILYILIPLFIHLMITLLSQGENEVTCLLLDYSNYFFLSIKLLVNNIVRSKYIFKKNNKIKIFSNYIFGLTFQSPS